MHQHGSAGGPFFHGADYSIAEARTDVQAPQQRLPVQAPLSCTGAQVNSASFLSTFCVYLPHFRQVHSSRQVVCRQL